MHRVTRSTVLITLTIVLVLALPWASLSVAAQRPERELTPAERNQSPPPEGPPSAPTSDRARTLPSGILFVENVGQFAEGARFQMWGGPGVTWLAEDALWITLLEQSPGANPEQRGPSPGAGPVNEAPRAAVHLRLSFPGANAKARLEPFGPVETAVSYFIGDDPEKWHSGVPVWSGVRYVDLYPGVDLVLDATIGGRLPWRLEATSAEASLAAVRLRVEGAESLDLLGSGDGFRVRTTLGDLTLPLLAVPDATEGAALRALGGPEVRGDEVLAPFAAAAPSAVRLLAGPFDLRYATFLGGSSWDEGGGIAVDSAGCAYVTGSTYSSNFPAALGPGYGTSYNGQWEAFAVKLNPAGTGLVYATFLGGSSDDDGYGIAVDSAGCAYVTGRTFSRDFPAAVGPGYDTNYNDPPGYGYGDSYVVKLNASGTGLVYATFLGGKDMDWGGYGIAVDGSGCAYVTGWTSSSNFPAALGPGYDTTYSGGRDAYVVKLNAAGTSLVYATFLGGWSSDEGCGIAVDSAGCAYVTGSTSSPDFPAALGPGYDTSYNGRWDAFAVKLDAAGTGLVYATFLGGSDWDEGRGVAVDSAGCAYVTGRTPSSDFPAALGPGYDTSYNGGGDAFVVKLDATGTALVYATFLGGGATDNGYGIAVDSSGCAYVTGSTDSRNFPAALGPGYDTTYNGNPDAFVVKLNAAGTGLLYATFLGGWASDYGYGIALGRPGAVYVAGSTHSSDFPAALGPGYDTSYNGGKDAFALCLDLYVSSFRSFTPDVDGDGKRELIVWRPSNGRWYVLRSSTGYSYGGAAIYTWGTAGDVPLVGDVDGDGKADLIVWRPTNGRWYVLRSTTDYAYGSAAFYNWGAAGDVPLVGDVDGDGQADLIVWRPTNGKWYVLRSTTNYAYGSAAFYTWGTAGDVPMLAKLDGDVKDELIVWRPSNGKWYVLRSTANYAYGSAAFYTWGAAGDVPLLGDVDGDGKADIIVWRPTNGKWYVLRSTTNYAYGSAAFYNWGAAGDTPLMGNMENDNKDELIVWRPTNGRWYVLRSTTNYAYGSAAFYLWGAAGDVPM